MATTTEMFTSLEDQVLETVRQSQEAMVKVVKNWAEAGKSLVPDLPPLPFSDQLPNTVEMVENAFDFADKLLAAQREFASAIIDAAKPVLGKVETGNGAKTSTSRPSAKSASS